MIKQKKRENGNRNDEEMGKYDANGNINEAMKEDT